MEYSQIRHAIMPPLSRDDEHKIAVEFSRDRRAFANLVQSLPFTFKEMILDGDCDPPKAGQRWPMPRLEACHERILELTSRVEGSVTKRIVARAKWLKRRIDRARTKLILSNVAFVLSQVGKIPYRRIPSSDLVQEGILGLIEAIDRFEPKQGNRLSTYAVWWIRRAFSLAQQDTRRLIRIPEHTQLKMRALRRAGREFHDAIGREPTHEELAADTGLSSETVADLTALSREPVPLELFGAPTGMPEYLEVLVDSHSTDPLRETMNRNLCETIHSALGALATREARIIRLRFGIGGRRSRTLKEIGKVLRLSRERVRQIQCEALTKLKQQLIGTGLS